MMRLITLLIIIIIIIIIHSKKYDLLHEKVLDVSTNLIKCASLLKIGILQYRLHQAVGTFTRQSNCGTSNNKVMNTRLSY
jgi:hypothetical protein